MPRAVATFACLLVATALRANGAEAQTGQTGPSAAQPPDQIVLSGDVSIPRGREVGEVVLLHGTATIAGVVRGDVVVLDGPITVTGQVSGTIVALNGSVTLGPNAQVRGDVIARDRVRVAEGAGVGGRVRPGTAFTFRTPVDMFGAFAAWLAVVVSTLLFGAGLLLIAPRGSEAVADAGIGSPWRAAGIGVAVALALPLVAVVAVVSLVGLPLGLALLLGLFLVLSAALALQVQVVGRAVWRPPRSRWAAFGIGWAIFAALSAVPVVGAVAWIAGAVFGLGAATLAAWRARGAGGRHRPGGKMPAAVPSGEPQPMITERAMGQEGTGI